MKFDKLFSNNSLLILLAVVALLLVLCYLRMNQPDEVPVQVEVEEGYYNYDENSPADNSQVEGEIDSAVNNVVDNALNVDAAKPLGTNEQPKGLGQNDTVGGANQLPSECYPKDVLRSADLLPRDAESKWAQSVPSGQGSLSDQNFLTAGFHVGVNTVGQSLRNANYQLRSEPPNPQVKVSPWMQSTIEPDTNRKPLEIGQ